MTCPNCRTVNPGAARFCFNCGAALGASPAAEGERRLVTVLFADVVGSTSWAERVDPEVATTAYLKQDRAGKVFVDSTRSGGATVVAAYSPRVRPGVPVSFPLAWRREVR